MLKAFKDLLRLFGIGGCGSDKNSHIICLLQETISKQNKIMTALESLNSSVVALTLVVDDVVTVLNTPHPTEAQVQAAADAVASQIGRLNAALGVKGDAASDPAAAVAAPTA